MPDYIPPIGSNPKGKVQVSRAFLDGVWLLLDTLKDYPLDDISTLICKCLQREADEKFAAIEQRVAFTKYKTAAPNSDVRHSLRATYLDMVGIHKDWCSQKESLF